MPERLFAVSLLSERARKIFVNLRDTRLKLGGSTEMFDRIADSLLFEQNASEIKMRLGISRIDLKRLVKMSVRTVKIALRR